MKLLSQEQHDYLVSIVKEHTSNECTEMLNKRFNLNLRVNQIRAYKKNHKLSGGIDTKFKKGHVPANKGKKQNFSLEVLERIKKGWFKKGQEAKNHRPVGSERVNIYGYVEIKVAEPNIWKLKHRFVWEEHHGEIPKGNIISFINGDSTDCRIENLIMIDNQINAVFNVELKAKERPLDVVDVVRDIVKIRNKIKELKHE